MLDIAEMRTDAVSRPLAGTREEPPKAKKEKKDAKNDDVMSLLSLPSAREKENKKVGEEILDLLSKPTAKERSLAERFRSQGGSDDSPFLCCI